MKKGFTLAEVLMVLVVIGVITTMTIPSLSKGAQEARHKGAYKKALSNIVNLVSGEKVVGRLPTRASIEAGNSLFDSLASNLQVTGYVSTADSTNGIPLNGGVMLSTNNNTSDMIKTEMPTEGSIHKFNNWILTEDNIAYLVTLGGATSTACGTKMQIAELQSDATQGGEPGSTLTNDSHDKDTLAKNSCFVIYVDVNGLASAPNAVRNNFIAKNDILPSITADTFPIYVGLDGATAGSLKTTISGRFASDLK